MTRAFLNTTFREIGYELLLAVRHLLSIAQIEATTIKCERHRALEDRSVLLATFERCVISWPSTNTISVFTLAYKESLNQLLDPCPWKSGDDS